MNETQRWKVRKIVEFIRGNEMALDWIDFQFGENWKEALAELGIVEPLSNEEEVILRRDLMEIAGAQQTREIARIAWQKLHACPERAESILDNAFKEDWPEL